MDTKRSSSPPGQLKNMLKHNRWKSFEQRKNMQISIVLPDAIAHYLTEQWGDLDTRIMEMIAVEAYRQGLISVGKLRELLGMKTRLEVDTFLQSQGIYLAYNEMDLEQDHQTHQQLQESGIL